MVKMPVLAKPMCRNGPTDCGIHMEMNRRRVKTTFGRLTLPNFQSYPKALVRQDSVKILESPDRPVNHKRMSRNKLTHIGQLIFDRDAKAAQSF